MMLVEETTVPQSALPVATFKDHMQMGSGFSDDGIQDAVLEGFLRAALAAIEARTGKITIERTFSVTFTDWRDYKAQPFVRCCGPQWRHCHRSLMGVGCGCI